MRLKSELSILVNYIKLNGKEKLVYKKLFPQKGQFLPCKLDVTKIKVVF